jgi:F-type H+-transporting ATPase subunit delta
VKDSLAARRYAKAMMGAYGTDLTRLEAISDEFGVVARKFIGDRTLRDYMLNPVARQEEKSAILADILKSANASDEVINSVRTVLEGGRFNMLGLIAEEFEAQSFERLGKVKVEVIAATDLDDSQRSALEQKLSAMTGKQAVMTVSTDQSLLGGVIAKVGSKVYDGSVKNQLKALKVRM